MKWPIEVIPDEDLLYRRVHANLLLSSRSSHLSHSNDGLPLDLTPGAFRDNDGISVDWSKHSTPSESKNRAIEPAKNSIIQIKAGGVRWFKSLSVDHEPEDDNRSHSSINGLKACRREDQTDIRKRLARLSSWAIQL